MAGQFKTHENFQKDVYLGFSGPARICLLARILVLNIFQNYSNNIFGIINKVYFYKDSIKFKII